MIFFTVSLLNLWKCLRWFKRRAFSVKAEGHFRGHLKSFNLWESPWFSSDISSGETLVTSSMTTSSYSLSSVFSKHPSFLLSFYLLFLLCSNIFTDTYFFLLAKLINFFIIHHQCTSWLSNSFARYDQFATRVYSKPLITFGWVFFIQNFVISMLITILE